MADDEWGEKTEEPTAKRRSESRGKGQVAKSQDLSTAAVLLASFVGLYAFGPGILHALKDTMVLIFQAMSDVEVDMQSVTAFTLSGAVMMVKVVGPLVLTVMAGALAINLYQVGFLITFHPIEPNLDKFNPVQGLTRIFSTRNLMKFAQSLAKVCLIGGIVAWKLYVDLPQTFVLMEAEAGQIMVFIAERIWELALWVTGALLVVGILDYMYQRWQTEQELRMTKQEVKEEMKQMEGDPKVKERRREIMRKLFQQRMLKKVPQADVVVTNPTHYAVALQYDPDEMAAPVVLAKGADLMAKRIRELAAEHEVPMVQRPVLARALYDKVEIGSPIPEDLFSAVAEVLAYVYQLAGKLPGGRKAG